MELQRERVNQWADDIWEKIVHKVSKTSHRIGVSFPYASVDGVYTDEDADWWTNGFWPGLLWLIYQHNGDERLKSIAAACEEKLDEPMHAYTGLHHDVGFMWTPTAIAQYKLLGNEASKVRALTVASHLAGRYNAKGKFIRAWNQEERVGWAIIDCMMNLPLLYWASETTGDPRFHHIAVEHANTTLREFIRPDGSVRHIVHFSPETGERIGVISGQGYSEDSAWARGTSWAIYGFALSYRYTKDLNYLAAAKQTASFFLSKLQPNQAPSWDFRAPEESKSIHDSSAAACVASGLLELAKHVRAEEALFYEQKAIEILRMLDQNYGAWDDAGEEGLIRRATANYPKKHFVEVPIIYGDYYFAEAISKLRGNELSYW